MTIKEYRTPKTIIATDYGARIPYHGTIDLTMLTPSADGSYRIPAGLAWRKVPKGNDVLLVPAKNATLTASAAGGATLLSVTEGYASVFKAGDALVSSEDYGTVTLSGTFTGAEVITVTIAGKAYPIDVSRISSYTLAEVAAYVSRHLDIKKTLNSQSAGAVVHIYADRGSTPTLAVSVAGGTGVATASGAALGGASIGQVLSVSVENSTVTLATGLSAARPAGMNIGVATSDQLDGFTVTEFDPDTNRGSVGLWTSGTFSKGDFYFDRSYAAAFPEVKLT